MQKLFGRNNNSNYYKIKNFQHFVVLKYIHLLLFCVMSLENSLAQCRAKKISWQ